MVYLEKQIRTEQLGWFINLRWAAVVGGLLILWVGPLAVPVNIQYGKLFACVGLLATLNAAYFFYWRRVRALTKDPERLEARAGKLLHLQMALDLILLTAMLFFSGGAENPIFLFYLFHVAIGVMIFPWKDTLLYSLPAVALPWIFYFIEPMDLSHTDFWKDNLSFMRDHELTLLWVYTVTVAGVWFFLLRLALDISIKEGQLFRATTELKEANDKLKQLDVYKKNFIKQVVSQLKTPVIDIDFDLTAIEKALPEMSGRAEETVGTAKKRVWSLLSLIDDLTWVSKVEAEDVPFKKEWVNVYEALLRKIQVIEKEAAIKGIVFKLHGSDQAHLWVDREAFERVAENLLSNALKYTPEGIHAVIVEIEVEGDRLMVAFDDEGIGIPSKQQEKLFHDFFRATNAKNLEKFGTGLGLSIVKRILDWHGATIRVKSKPKEGTRIETRWPYSLE